MNGTYCWLFDALRDSLPRGSRYLMMKESCSRNYSKGYGI